MKVYLETSRGEGKTESEDRVVVGQGLYSETTAEITRKAGLVAVADGVGGNNAGGVAADIVCKELIMAETLSFQRFAEINKTLLEAGRGNSELEGMATTLTGVGFSESGKMICFHVGNTRIYAIKAQSYLSQITQDDTTVDYLLKSGKLSEEEAQEYSARNEITACFGGFREELFKIHIQEIDSKRYTHFLLTSDGIHEYLTEDDMEDILEEANGEWGQAVRELVNCAKQNGSKDDCSAVVVIL